MCGRFTNKLTWDEIVRLYRLTMKVPPHNLPPRYNICPTDPVDAVAERDGNRDFVRMRWGLVPSWWPKPLKGLKAATFNARSGRPIELLAASAPSARGANTSRNRPRSSSGCAEAPRTLDMARAAWRGAAAIGPSTRKSGPMCPLQPESDGIAVRQRNDAMSGAAPALRVVVGERIVACGEDETLVSVVCSSGAPDGAGCPAATQTTGLCMHKWRNGLHDQGRAGRELGRSSVGPASMSKLRHESLVGPRPRARVAPTWLHHHSGHASWLQRRLFCSCR
jgi:hypothetical protein